MSDPIGAARLTLEGLSPRGNTPFVQGDGPRSYTVDLGKGVSGSSFGDTISSFVNQVSDAQDRAGELRDRFLRGEQVEPHQMMAAANEAGLALDLMVELRNKVLDAYRTLITMQS